MRYHYICNNCVEQIAGKPIGDLTVDEYQSTSGRLAIQVAHGINEKPIVTCQTCGKPMQKLLSLGNAYVRGYGLMDKKGVLNDMNLHTITSGRDPYAEHRKRGDSTELVRKLRRQKNHIPRTKDVFLG